MPSGHSDQPLDSFQHALALHRQGICQLYNRQPDWRWLLDRADSPWYPSARLFRQRRIGNWDDVIDELRSALNDWAGGDGRTGPAAVSVRAARKIRVRRENGVWTEVSIALPQRADERE